MTLAELVARIVAQFDVDEALAKAWVNERHRLMVAMSQWRTSTRSLGTTVAGTKDYALPADVVDIRRIRTLDGTTVVSQYDRASTDQMWDLDDATSGVTTWGSGGLFSEDSDSDGASFIRLYPTPDTAGYTIQAMQALQPADLTADGDTPLIPLDLHRHLLDGCRADGYAENDDRTDLADYYEQRFSEGVELLRRRKNTRVGSGPQRVRALGVNL